MTKKGIRLEYSGFVIFATKILSVATGLIFQLMIARSTTRPEYDIWFNMTDIMVYFTLLAGVLPFWTMRFAAREKRGAVKTGIVSNLVISILATLIYLPLVPFITSTLGIDPRYLLGYFLIAVQVIESYSMNTLEACLQARMPHAVGYGLLIQQFGKVSLGYVLIIQLGQPLLGAVLATIVAFLVQIGYYVKLLHEELKQKISWNYLRQWLKGSVANIYNVAGNQLANFVFIMLFAYGGEGARGVYGAAIQIANVITYASYLAFALYPKLLAQRKSEDVTTSLKMVLMFAIPMTACAIFLSDSYITILKEEYTSAGIVLTVLAVDALIMVISGFFSSVLFGIETVDETAKISFKELVKSRLFVAFSLPYIHSAITIPTTYYLLIAHVRDQPTQAALYVSTINTVAHFIMLLVVFGIVRKEIKINIPWRSISKYVFASAIMSIVLLIIPHPTQISLTLVATVLGGATYLALLMATDKEARRLPKTMWGEIRSRKGNRDESGDTHE